MSSATPRKRLRLRRADRCVVCQRDLRVGEQAVWDAGTRTVTCLACELGDAPVSQGTAGASAQREYERRHQRREQHARDTLGILGVILARATDEPQSTTRWKQGARGEQRTAARLDKHLHGHPVRLLHDRRIRGHGPANIDHLAIGPGGVTVIDTKTQKGPVRVDHVGGLFTDRHQILLIGGRDQTKLIDGIERQVRAVRTALRRANADPVDIRGALCFPNPDIPIFRQLTVRDIIATMSWRLRLVAQESPDGSRQVPGA